MSDSIQIRDLKLASVLVTMGAAMEFEPVQGNGGAYSYFCFQNTAFAQELMEAWDCPIDGYGKGALSDPKHPFWFLRAAFRNRERFLDAVNKGVKMSFVNKSDKTFIMVPR